MATQTKDTIVKRTEGAPSRVSHSRYDLSRHNFTTLRFGEITPFEHLECVAGDRIPLKSSHTLRSLSLKSPLLSDLYFQKDYFAVPMECILPNSWNKIITNPITGDDVDIDKVSSIINLPQANILNIKPFSSLGTIDDTASSATMAIKARILNVLAFYANIYSRASIPAQLDVQLGTFMFVYNQVTYYDIDACLEAILADLAKYYVLPTGGPAKLNNKYQIDLIPLAIDTSTDIVTPAPRVTFYGTDEVSCMAQALQFARQNPLFSVNNSGKISVEDKAKFETFNPRYIRRIPDINIASVLAYQLVCTHFYTNDRIDFIYSAELYREMMLSLGIAAVGNVHETTESHFYEYNGSRIQYDSLSGHFLTPAFQNCFNVLADFTFTSLQYSNGDENYNLAYRLACSWAFMCNVFGPHSSLRHMDRITSVRKTPLALGNTEISVAETQSVSIIDVTRNIQMQRFLNLVNKTGRKFEDYIGKIFGTRPNYDYHNPSYLANTRDKVFSYETENTSDAQQTQANSVTANLKSTGSKYSITFDCDRPSILLGLCFFDMPRAYTDYLDRETLHHDRFDYFLPELQHIGDQALYLGEFQRAPGVDLDGNLLPFGYEVRNAEYKSRVDVAHGGIIGFIPSWQFLFTPVDVKATSVELDSTFIRSYPAEFDQFFLSLVNYSPAGRFHFIADFYNEMEADRPMIANPQIL